MKNRFTLPLLLPLSFLLSGLQLNAQNYSVKISGPTTVCNGCHTYTAVVEPSDPTNPPNAYEWTVTGPTGFSQIGTQKAITICFPSNGAYHVLLQLLSPNGTLTISDTLTVNVVGFLPVEIQSSNLATCNQDSLLNSDDTFCEKVCPYSTVNYSVSLDPGNPGGNNYQISWNVVGAQSFTVNQPQNTSVTVNWGPTGSGSVSVTVFGFGTSGSQCSGEDAICVTIIEEPRAKFNTDPAPPAADTLQICKGQTVYFENQSQNADTYEWTFSDDGSTTPAIDPQHTFQTPGFYTVQLIARSACLCADTTETVIEVLDAESPALECVGDVCPGATVNYRASANCSGISWALSPNGTLLAGGAPGADSITVEWGAGPVGAITLSNFSCTGLACPQPTVVRIPIIDDNAEIRGAEQVCPDAEEVYYIEAFGGTGFSWTLSGGGTIVDGQGTNRVSIRWASFPNPGTTYWLSVQYDNCYLGCGGMDSIPVRIVPPFYIAGPFEACQNASGDFLARLSPSGTNINCNWTLLAPDGTIAWASPAPTAASTIPFANGPGIYRVFAVPDDPALSCTDQAEWAVQVPDLPAGLSGINGPNLICPGETFTYEATGATPGSTIRWEIQNGPGAPQTVLGNPVNVSWNASGPYQLTVEQLSSDGLGCTAAPAQLNLQTLSALALNGPAETCLDTKLSYSAPQIPGMTYQWSLQPIDAGTITAGQGTNQVEVFWQSAGNHQLRLDLCGQSATQSVSVNAQLMPAVLYPASLCPGATATVQTTTAYTSYSWTKAGGSSLGSSATVDVGPGSYAVTVTDANGCTGNTNFTIGEDPAPNLSVSTANPTAFCNNSGSVTMYALVSSGGPISYEWFQNGMSLGTNAATYTTNQYGAYTVQATNAAGCTASAGPINVIEDCGGGGGGGFPGPPLPSCPPGSVSIQIDPSPRCDSMTFTVSGTTMVPGSGSWVFGQSGVSVIGNAAGDQAGFVFPEPGYFIVVAYASLTNGASCRVIDSVTVEAVAQFKTLPACLGAAYGFEDRSAFLPNSGITAWAWDFGDPASGGNNTGSGQMPTHVYNAAGTYSVMLTITANSGCTASKTNPATVPQPIPPVITLPANSCASNSLEFSATGSNLTWDFGDPASGNLNTASGQTVYHQFALGNYTVTATVEDDYGCTASATETVNIAPNGLTGLITPANPTPICENSSLLLTAPAGGLTYLWSDGSTADTLAANQEGLYTVTLTDANGCTYAPPPVAVSVKPGPDALIKALLTNSLGQAIGVAYPSLSVCAGEEVRLFAAAQGSYTYSWSTGSTGTNIEFTEVRNNLLPIGTHVYTVTVTDGTTGCTSVTDPFVVTVHPVPSGFSIANNVAPACAGSVNTLSYTGPAPANWQFIWNTGQTDVPLVTKNPGVYTLRVINEFGCEARSNPLTVLPGPNVLAIPAGCHTRCKPDTVCLPAIPNIVSWQWFFNGNPIPGATSTNFVADQSGTYYAELTDALGCTNQSGPLTLNLLDGYGNVLGQVWSDVNDNGIIDGPDTLVSGIPVQLLDSGSPVAAAWSGAGGAFAFANILSKNYTVEIDAGQLPAGWQIVIGQNPANLAGCDAETQTALLVRSVCLTVITSTVQLSACPGQSALYNGVNIPAGGSQAFTFTTADGCDSVLTVSVGILPVSTGTLDVSVCPGASYDYNGTAIPAGSSQQFVLQNYLGCDSVLTVSVGTLPISTGNLDVSACSGASYDYNGTAIPAGSSQQFILQNYLGCDSVLTVSVGTLPISTGNLDVSACPGASYDYNGTAIPAGSSQQFVLQNYLGCDSVLTVSVGILPVSTGNLDVSVCPGSSYDYNGTAIPAGSSQQFILQNYLGCDSVLTVNVGALPVSTGTLNVSVCPGSSYDYNGTAIPAGSSQQFVLQNYLGCDSVLTVSVGTLPVSTGTLEISVCPGSSYDYNGTAIPAGSSQQFFLQNYLGCDSVLTVSVGTLPVSTGTLDVSVCPGASYDYNGTSIPAGSSQQFFLQNYLGCDSVLTVSVGILPVSTGTIDVSVCPGSSYDYNGTSIPAGSSQQFVLQNYLGCDSVLTVNVGISPTSASTLQAKICPGETFPYQGSILQIGETQAFTLQNVAGCDSVVTIVVSGLNSSSETLAVSVCPGETYTFDGVELQAGDTHVFQYTNSEGCDSIITVVVSAFPTASFDLAPKASCQNTGTGSLTVQNSTGGLPPYQYSLDGVIFQPAPVFADLLPGDYTVWLEDGNGCLFQTNAGIPAVPPLEVELENAVLPCDSGGVQLAPLVSGDLAGVSYRWHTGVQTPSITVYDPGLVWVEVENLCETQRREAEVRWADVDAGYSFVYVPNVFAPLSNDPDNSRFKPFFAPGLSLLNYKLEVFDRWGNKLFSTKDLQEGWAGPFRQEDMQPAVFVWYMFVDIDYCGRLRSLRLEGDVTIVR